jgi:hypothetical protein
MNELLEKYNNNNLKISLLNKEYSALLVNKNNQLILQLIDGVDRDTYLKLKNSFPIVNGKIEGRNITFFNLVSSSSSANGATELFSMTFKIDMFVEGMKYTSKKNKKIKSINFEYYDLENFSISPFYDYGENLNPIFKYKHNEFNFNDYKLTILIGNLTTHGHSIYKCKKRVSFTIEYRNKQTLQNTIQDVWALKCFIGIISKRIIGIKEIKINDNNILFMNLTYFEDKDYKNEFLQHEYEQFVLTLEDLENDFKLIYEQFLVVFKDITPIFDIYLDMIEKETSRMNRFLNCNQIIEYMSKEYDNVNAKQVWIDNGKPGFGITLSDRIESMIKNLNYIWGFKKTRIHTISRKIADGRNYFNHHSQPLKKMENDELFRFSYFLEDLLLGYLYNKIGVSQKTIKERLNYNLYYDKKHIK